MFPYRIYTIYFRSGVLTGASVIEVKATNAKADGNSVLFVDDNAKVGTAGAATVLEVVNINQVTHISSKLA